MVDPDPFCRLTQSMSLLKKSGNISTESVRMEVVPPFPFAEYVNSRLHRERADLTIAHLERLLGMDNLMVIYRVLSEDIILVYYCQFPRTVSRAIELLDTALKHAEWSMDGMAGGVDKNYQKLIDPPGDDGESGGFGLALVQHEHFHTLQHVQSYLSHGRSITINLTVKIEHSVTVSSLYSTQQKSPALHAGYLKWKEGSRRFRLAGARLLRSRLPDASENHIKRQRRGGRGKKKRSRTNAVQN